MTAVAHRPKVSDVGHSLPPMVVEEMLPDDGLPADGLPAWASQRLHREPAADDWDVLDDVWDDVVPD